MSVARLKQIVRSRIGAEEGVLHSVGTLVGGTAFAQALAVLALPLLTRLYSPGEFSVLAVYAAVLSILVVAACLRLEIAIPLPEDDGEAASLLVASLLSGLTLALLLGVLVAIFGTRLAVWLEIGEIAPYVWLIPIGVGLASCYSAFQYWSTRRRKFSRIARTRVTQALGGIGIQTGAGVAGFGPIGLLIGHAVSGGAGVLALAHDAWKSDRIAIRNVTLRSMREALIRYSRFPKYSTWEALANTAGSQLPIILIAAWAAAPEAGYLLLATRMMATPMTLVGGAVAQVYLAHAPEELRAGRLGEFSVRIFSGLLKAGVGPLLFAGIVAAPLAEVVFGRGWQRAGELVAWLTPWFIFQFLSAPVSMVMHVTGRQKGMLALTISGLALRIGTLSLAYFSLGGYLSEAYALAGAVFYGICAVLFYRAADVSPRELVAAARPGFFVVAVWGLLGLLTAFLLKAHL